MPRYTLRTATSGTVHLRKMRDHQDRTVCGRARTDNTSVFVSSPDADQLDELTTCGRCRTLAGLTRSENLRAAARRIRATQG